MTTPEQITTATRPALSLSRKDLESCRANAKAILACLDKAEQYLENHPAGFAEDDALCRDGIDASHALATAWIILNPDELLHATLEQLTEGANK